MRKSNTKAKPRRVLEHPRGAETTCVRGALMTKRICAVEECQREAKVRGWCRTHYDRWRSTGSAGGAIREYRSFGCAVDGCNRRHVAGGFCNAHYHRVRKSGDPGSAEIRIKDSSRECSIDGCSGKVKGHGLCVVHWARKRKTGSVGSAEIKHLTDPTVRNKAGEKRCPSCQQWLPIANYTRCASTSDGLYKRCRECTRAAILLRQYNLTMQAYEALLLEQGGGCWICSAAPSRPYGLHVDHDHSCCGTRKRCCGSCIRGLLCSPCNTALGLLKDDPLLLRSAAKYLERNRDRR